MLGKRTLEAESDIPQISNLTLRISNNYYETFKERTDRVITKKSVEALVAAIFFNELLWHAYMYADICIHIPKYDLVGLYNFTCILLSGLTIR